MNAALDTDGDAIGFIFTIYCSYRRFDATRRRLRYFFLPMTVINLFD